MNRSRRTLLLAVVVSFGCSKKSADPAPSPPEQAAQAPLRVTSFPLRYAQVGSAWSYQPFLSRSGETSWSLTAAPSGARIEGGLVSWTPGDGQMGSAQFTLRGQLGDSEVEQSFGVEVSQQVLQAQAQLAPDDPNGATLSVDAPLSSIKGSAVVVPPGALEGQSGDIQLSISEVRNAPLPLAAQLSGLTADDLRPVEFGPSGLAFSKPITIYVPLSDSLLAQPALDVQTYDYASGRWESVPVLAIDRANKVAVAEVRHFSLYAATTSTPALSLTFNSGSPACASALVVRAPLAVRFDALPAQAVNGVTSATSGSSVTALLGALTPGETLQAQTVLTAQRLDATGSASAWTLLSATRLANGNFRVQAASSSQPTSFLDVPPEVTLAEVEGWLDGSRVDLVLPGLSGGAEGTATAALYLLPAGADPLAAPLVAGDALGRSERFTATHLTAASGLDDDCDGAPNAFDATPSGTAPPTVVPQQAAVRLALGGSTQLSVSSNAATFEWRSSDPSLSLAVGASGKDATVTGTAVGAFEVVVEGTLDGVKATARWAVVVDAPAAQNTPPRVSVSASPSLVVREGEAVRLSAIGSDAEQAPASLSYRWTSSGGALSSTSAPTVEFVAPVAGDYVVEVTAFDGALASAPRAVTVSVLAAQTNRAPEPPRVTPLSVLLEHAPGVPVTQRFVALATDPDGDVVTYRFALDPTHPPHLSFSPQGPEVTLTAYEDGVYVFDVSAIDARGAASAWTRVRVQVAPTLPPSPVDVDGDGYPSTIDCDDSNPRIFPGAVELCGDAVDQDCNGSDLPRASCDEDRDRYTGAQGDCDDANPARNPGAAEACNGIDDNCEGRVDEGFLLSETCSVGTGACQATGTTVCNATRTSVVCSATARVPAAETCNGLDDDCNGRLDDVSGASSSGDLNNCGGCGLACRAPPNTAPQCTQGGCQAPCAQGFFDADRDPGNGCECQPNAASNGFEICNGRDDNCNGSIDEGTSKPFYTGPLGSEGQGQCAAGMMTCVAGVLVEARAQRLPSPELCDGQDNNCDGKVDEGFGLSADPQNCGACGRACGPTDRCELGRCVTPSSGADGGLPPAPCPFGSVLCGTVCTRIPDDPRNCGACGVACAAGDSCKSGQCVTPGSPASACLPEAVACPATASTAAYCSWASIDPLNCGGCGRACALGSACVAGQCQSAGTTTPCGQFDRCGPMCTSLQQDPTNCGACGVSCGPNMDCAAGRCAARPTPDGGSMCTSGPSCPKPGTSELVCTDTRYDSMNCGACGRVCPAAAPACVNGACGALPASDGGPQCPASATMCTTPMGGTTCADLRVDGLNCGACGIACGPGSGCNNGICQQPTGADGGAGPCGGGLACTTAAGGQYCVDPLRDVMNCGGCAKPCALGFGCNNGACQPMGAGDGGTVTCLAPMNECRTATGGSYCADVRFDAMNCGRCGQACGAGQFCNSGLCQGVAGDGGQGCPSSMAQCSDATGGLYCSDLKADPRNCGRCGNACAAGSGCNNGTCQPMPPPPDGGVSCFAPMSQCTTAAGGSYCTDPQRDSLNCGRCGNACAAGSGCNNGTCQPMPPPDGGVACFAPMSQCTTAAGGSYCVDLKYDFMNCGACGNACAAGTGCNNGTCQPMPPPPDGGAACFAPMSQCSTAAGGSYCVDLKYDFMNCGACGRMCGSGEACDNGLCQPMQPPPDGGAVTCQAPAISCRTASGGSFCADPRFDSMNCGACGVMCGATQTCNNGSCQPLMPPPGDGGSACPATMLECATAAGGAYCTDPQRDSLNCGACGNACAAGTGCNNGTCQPMPPPDGGAVACQAPTISCSTATGGSFCADPGSDPMNCGACGVKCGAAQVCLGGACT